MRGLGRPLVCHVCPPPPWSNLSRLTNNPRPPLASRLQNQVPYDSATPSTTTTGGGGGGASFPLSYTLAAAHFLARAFPQRTAATELARPSSAVPTSNSDSLGESGVVVGLDHDEDEEEEEDEDEDLDWDLVSV